MVDISSYVFVYTRSRLLRRFMIRKTELIVAFDNILQMYFIVFSFVTYPTLYNCILVYGVFKESSAAR